MKNFLLRILVKVYRISLRKRQSDRFDRFLIVSTTGLGDTLWATPAVRALRMHFPSAYIGLLTTSIGANIFQNNPYVDEIFTIENPALPSLFRLYTTLKNRVIDSALIFHQSQRPIIPFCHWIGSKEIIGTRGFCKGLDDLLTKALVPKREHEITRRLAIVSETGAIPESSAMELFLSPEHEQKIDNFLKEHAIPTYLPIVGLHPGAKDLFKQWSPDGFIEVGKRLSEERGCQIIVTGDHKEKELVQKIGKGIPRSIIVQGRFTIQELAALQKRMKLFITNDTGPMHLASAMGTPLLALFGPTDPIFCGPTPNPNTRLITISPTCTPCLKKQCRAPFCLLQINPDSVFSHAVDLLDTPNIHR